jgi:hypothetical protein
MAKKLAHGGARVGAGRKPNPNGPAVVVTVSLPGDVAGSLDAYCKANEVGKSAAVTEALRGWLKRKKR